MTKANSPGHIILRKMTLADIPLGMELKSLAGWNQLEADWKMLLEAGGDNFVASLDGHDAGTVISIPYQDRFTWIGMVLVDPKAKRKGVGKALLNTSIEIAKPKGAVRLDATAEGFGLYSRLGFRTEYELVRMVRRAAVPRPEQNTRSMGHVSQILQDELGSITRLDTPVFGADRSRILRHLHRRNPEYALCRRDKGSVRAYCLGQLHHPGMTGKQYAIAGPEIG